MSALNLNLSSDLLTYILTSHLISIKKKRSKTDFIQITAVEKKELSANWSELHQNRSQETF